MFKYFKYILKCISLSNLVKYLLKYYIIQQNPVFFQVSGPLSWGKWQASMFLWLPCTTLMSSQKESREFRWAFKWVSLSSSAQHRSLEVNAQNTADTQIHINKRRNAHITKQSSGNLHDLFIPRCMQGNRVQHPLLIDINDYTRKKITEQFHHFSMWYFGSKPRV